MYIFAEKRTFLRVAWLVAILAVIFGELLPGESLPIRVLAHFHIGDKVQHFTAYFVVALIPALNEKRATALVASVIAVVLGILLEFGQIYSVGRFFEIADMVANTFGVCGGLALGLRLRIKSANITPMATS